MVWRLSEDGTYQSIPPDEDVAAAIEAAAATREVLSATRDRIERTIAEARRLRYLSQITRRHARSLRAVQ